MRAKRVFLWAVAAGVVASACHASPPTLSISEDEKELSELVRRLGETKDADGLLIAWRAASQMRSGHGGRVKRRIIAALGTLKPTRAATDVLIEEMKNGSGPQTRIDAIRTLGDWGKKRVLDVLVAVAQEPSSKGDGAHHAVRVAAVQALAKLGGARAKALLLKLLADREQPEPVRNAVIPLVRHLELSGAERHTVTGLITDPRESPSLISEIVRLPRRTDDPSWIGPVIKALSRVSELMESEDKTAKQRASKTFRSALRVLEGTLQKHVEPIGCRLTRRMGAVTLARATDVLITYDHAKLLRDASERGRVLAFWTNWWETNKAKLSKPNGTT